MFLHPPKGLTTISEGNGSIRAGVRGAKLHPSSLGRVHHHACRGFKDSQEIKEALKLVGVTSNEVAIIGKK